MKQLTQAKVTGMITRRLNDFAKSLPSGLEPTVLTGTISDIENLSEGQSMFVEVKKHQLSPVNPTKNEMREYRRINGTLYYRVWNRS